MAKKKSKSSKKEKVSPAQEKAAAERVTMQALEEMSDSDDEEIPESQWTTKAKDLRQQIEAGKFDKVLEALKKAKEEGKNDEEFEEDTLGSSDDEDQPKKKGKAGAVNEKTSGAKAEDEKDVSGSEENSGDEESESDSDEDEEAKLPVTTEAPADAVEEEKSGDEESGDEKDSDEDDDEEEEDDEVDDKAQRLTKNNQVNSKALSVVTAELVASHTKLPWAETFHIVPPTPLPFGEKIGDDSSPLDIHDDLKREVAFYNSALEAVHAARLKCKEAGIPFARPDDFFAEMIKTDDHMAKVKDRLIFETKKMEAVAQRKSNREHKLRAKESQANKQAEKAKRKREHFQEVEEWANTAARNRGGALRDDADEVYMKGGPNKKREAANRKYGFGGKKGRFKQNDRASMNDVSGFNPRGNFPGMGTKKSASGKGAGSGAGAGRQGKRARDAKRARR